MDRRRFLQACSALGLSGTLFPGALYARVSEQTPTGSASQQTLDGPAFRTSLAAQPPSVEITPAQVASAAAVAGLEFTEEEQTMIAEDLTEALSGYETLREIGLPNSRLPSMTFDPRIGGARLPQKTRLDGLQMAFETAERPARDEDLAFAGVRTLATLLRTRQVSSVELTELFLARLREYDDQLQAVITYTEKRAMDAAKAADRELDAGEWRGPLHGVPYGAKDLLAIEGYPTTWGAEPYKNRTINETATVIRKLDEAGAICLAKLTLGALAWGDVWFGGTTKNPWNVEQGSSGSSAGPGSAVAAGCVPFAIGSETLGSIVSPSTRNGVTGFRPSFGAVSRHGAMTLSWTMDKLGPMARSAVDCAIVMDAIRGGDAADPSSVDLPFSFNPEQDLTDLRIGYLRSAFEEDYPDVEADRAALDVVKTLTSGIEPVEWPDTPPAGPILNTLQVEAAAAFDDLTRSGLDDMMVRQERNAWPHVFRAARLVPAVEFIQMNRHRTMLMQEMHRAMEPFDVVVTPAYAGGTLGITNLTGHPCVCLPNEFAPLEDADAASPRREPRSFTLIGGLYKDAEVARVAHAYQQQTDFHTRRPPVGS
jgi:Asp-tRNA(Asn)/Glu-tRNA(Gln) amidotransferase A subunit family amidase